MARDKQFGHFAAPKYAELYQSLISLGLVPIGAEFVYDQSYRGMDAPDWECAAPAGGFQMLAERRIWSDIRTAAFTDGNRLVADIASRSKTYLDLLSIRILQLSNAYNQALRAARDVKPDHFFGNRFQPYIDAALHAFVADAASFRDLIAETVWRTILGGGPEVTTLSSFLKKAKQNPHPLATSILAEGQAGGWLKILSDLRNEVIHVAPVGRSQSFHFCQAREVPCGEKKLTLLHYPLLAEDGSIRRGDDDDFVDFSDEAAIRANLEEYRAYCATSIDGLRYAWETTGKLVNLHREARLAASFRAERVTITDADIIGPVTVLRE